jgi:ABC-2 type transport system permease protein
MKRYFNIYWTIIKLNYNKSLLDKGNFFTGLFASLMWGVFSILAIHILSARTTSIYGWSRPELFVLIGVTNIILGSLFRMTATTNLGDLPTVIQTGALDSYLLKPINSQFIQIRLYGIVRLVIAIIFTFFMLSYANVAVTITSVIIFVILSIFGFIAIYSIWFLVMTFSIWFPDLHNLSEILYTTDGLTRFPPQVLWAMKIFIFYVFFPYTIAVSTPAKALLHTLTVSDVILLIGVSSGLLYLSNIFWKFALRYYTSASG